MMDDAPIFALWPDGFMCPIEDLHEFSHKGDDYERVRVLNWDAAGEPTGWVPE